MADVASSREQISEEILRRVGAATITPSVGESLHFVTVSRRLVMFDEVSADQQPALFLVEHGESYEQPNRGTPPRRVLEYSLFCYARAPMGATVGATLLNSIMAAIEVALAPDDFQFGGCTLGGLVQWCRLEGRVVKDPGDIDEQAMLVVPVRVMWP